MFFGRACYVLNPNNTDPPFLLYFDSQSAKPLPFCLYLGISVTHALFVCQARDSADTWRRRSPLLSSHPISFFISLTHLLLIR